MATETEVDPEHERAVDEFIAEARAGDPERVAEVEVKYPVLDERELAWRRSREVRLTESFENTLSLSSDIFGRRIAAPLVFRRSPMKTLIGFVAVALLAFAACASPSAKLPTASSVSSSHVCADKVAQLTVSGKVPGLWACLDADMQAELGNGTSDWTLDKSFASSWRYVGQLNDSGHSAYVYELTLTAEAARQAGSATQALIVYTDPDGLVWGVGVSRVVL